MILDNNSKYISNNTYFVNWEIQCFWKHLLIEFLFVEAFKHYKAFINLSKSKIFLNIYL